jgi:hypothetical protein
MKPKVFSWIKNVGVDSDSGFLFVEFDNEASRVTVVVNRTKFHVNTEKNNNGFTINLIKGKDHGEG